MDDRGLRPVAPDAHLHMPQPHHVERIGPVSLAEHELIWIHAHEAEVGAQETDALFASLFPQPFENLAVAPHHAERALAVHLLEAPALSRGAHHAIAHVSPHLPNLALT